MSSDTDTRVVGFSANTVSSTTLTNGTPLTFTTLEYDTHGAWNGTTYTIPITGKYTFNIHIYTTTGVGCSIYVYRGGAAYNSQSVITVVSGSVFGDGSIDLSFNAGDSVTFVPQVSGSLGSASLSRISGHRISGPSVIAASESVNAFANTGSSTASLSVGDKINYSNVLFDTHNAITTGVNSWQYKFPISGKYRISSYVYGATAVQKGLILNINGTPIISGYGTADSRQTLGFNGLVKVNAGDVATVTLAVNALTLDGISQDNYISIERIGN